MEEKKSKYEIKIEKLTIFRISMVLLFEFLFEFSFGLVFYIFTKEEKYYDKDTCVNLLYWGDKIWKLYTIEFSIAFVCFVIGLASFLCCKENLTKIYIGFNNAFKSVIFILSLIILSIITVVYNNSEECDELGQLTFIWLCFHYILLSIACLACLIIWVVTYIIYRRSRSHKKEEKLSLLQV